MAAGAEDDDAWLYGENEKADAENHEEGGDDSRTAAEDSVVVIIKDEVQQDDKEAGELSCEDDQQRTDEAPIEAVEAEPKEAAVAEAADAEKNGDGEIGDDDDEDDDDDDDDVQVTIRDIKSAPYTAYTGPPPTVNLNIKRGAPFGSNIGPGGGVGPGGAKTKGLDVDEVALLNGVSIYEFNIESIEDKPWRKPGADITDYFNYGFNEDTWKIYCDRQRKLRSDNNVPVKSALHLVGGGKDPLLMPIPPVNENSKYTGMASVPVLGSKKAGPPPGRKMSGSIDVIGGGAPSLPSRRPGGGKEGVIQVIGSVDSGSMGGLTLPPTHVPPPGYMGVPLDASNMSVPPPIPGMIPGVPPPGYDPGSFPPPRFTHPPPPIPGAGGDRSYDDRSSYYNGSNYGQPYGDDGGGGGSWPRGRDREREGREREGREREGRERDRSSRRPAVEYDEEEVMPPPRSSRRYREYYREREREVREVREGREGREGREMREMRERERGRDREREEEYEERHERRHREHRGDKEERHRSSRRRHHRDEEEEAEERRSSKHKHKRSKKERVAVVEEPEVVAEGSQDAPSETKME